MNELVALEILNTHGEMLARGQVDATQIMCQQYPELTTYFQIAEGLAEALKIVSLSADYINNLQSALLDYPAAEPNLWITDTSRRGWMIGGVAVGSAVTGLAAYALRRLRQPEVPAAAPIA